MPGTVPSREMLSRPQAFLRELDKAMPERPFAIRLWNGTGLPSTNGGGPTFEVRSPDAFAHALLAPGQLGLSRAYVSGALDVDDLEQALEFLDNWEPPPVDGRARARLAVAAARAFGLKRPPAPPKAELRPRGRRHSVERDARAVRHHYDLSNDFFKLLLGEELTYSCAFFSRGGRTLEEAQETKLELVCTKLALEPGQRVLDIGCGWGSFALHAAENHGVSVVGVILSEPQAALARTRAEERGVAERVEIRVEDYRSLTGEPFDAIASIGMVEHVGASKIDVYARQLARMLRRGGRVLNHGIATEDGRARGGPVLRALRLPGRRPASPIANPARTRAQRARDRAR